MSDTGVNLRQIFDVEFIELGEFYFARSLVFVKAVKGRKVSEGGKNSRSSSVLDFSSVILLRRI
jgi:hypothetical protein